MNSNNSSTWRLVIAAVIIYYVTVIFYRLFLHPLARFPGPRLAAISRWYEAYYDLVQGGQYTLKIAALHKIYGPIIRISPYELHVIDPAFFETLYGIDGRRDKYAWMYDAFGAKDSTIFGTDHDAHYARRRAIAPFFSKSKVASRQDVIGRNVEKLCERISKLAGTSFNLGAAISAFTRDVGNEFIVCKSYNELDLDDFGIDLSISSQGAGVFWRTTKHIRWFGPAVRAMPINWAMKVADKGTKSFLRYLKQSEQDTRDTFMAVTSPLPDDEVLNTIVYEIVHSNLPHAEKTMNRVSQEVATITGAAFETTANTLRLIVYHVFSNDDILRKLREEISKAAAGSVEPIQLKTLEQLPYLTSTLMEGMRMSPGISTRAARIADRDLYYRDWLIPAGTPVGMTTLLMHTDERSYHDPMRFNPDRWMDPTARKAAEKRFAPFSRGARICLGMHLAWAELYLLLTALVRGFNFTIKDATANDFELERDNFGIGTRAGCNLIAYTTRYEG